MASAICSGVAGLGKGAILGNHTPGICRLPPILDTDDNDPFEHGPERSLLHDFARGIGHRALAFPMVSWKDLHMARTLECQSEAA